jgi:3-hydroxyisobutyrate dehydrogenase-like beta-hydroxyacid dehydrogenase
MQGAHKPRAAYLGLGLMGAPMVRRLLAAGLDVGVWNRSPEKAEALRADGARVAATPGEAAQGAEIICLCLFDAAAVETALEGEDGLLAQAASGAVVVDFSSIPVEATRRFAAAAAQRGIAWVDAPVSGGPLAAASGRLTVFCGGETDAVARLEPVFSVVAGRVTHMGGIGAGQATKQCNQLIVSANLLAIAEAITLGERLGVDVARLPEALRGGYADSMPLQVFGPRMVQPPPDRLGAISTMTKDVAAISAAADKAALSLPLLQAVRAAYARAGDQGLADEDLSGLIRLYQDDHPVVDGAGLGA